MRISQKKADIRKQAENLLGNLQNRRRNSTKYGKQSSKQSSRHSKKEVTSDELNSHLDQFQELHGVQFTCSNVYTHSASTLKSDNTLIVLFQNQVQSEQKLVDYNTYKEYHFVDNSFMPEVSERQLPKPGAFLNLVQTTQMFGENKHMVSLNKRYVDPCYQSFRLIFSTNQTLVCLQRDDNDQKFLDIYRCDQEDQDFFKSSAVLSMSSHEYCFSVIAHEDCQVEFSANDKYLAIISEKQIQVYEITIKSRDDTLHESTLSLNESVDVQQVRLKAIENHENSQDNDHSNILDPIADFYMTNSTYSRIVCMQLSDSEDMMKDSWVVLESQEFNTLHFIVLCDLLPESRDHNLLIMNQIEEEKQEQLISEPTTPKRINAQTHEDNVQTKVQGLDFYKHSTAGRLIKLIDIDAGMHDDENRVIFQKDGSIALIQTESQIVELSLDMTDENFLEINRIPIKDPMSVEIFNYGMNDLVFCKRDHDAGTVTLSTLHADDPSAFSETQFEIHGKAEIIEITESTLIGNPFMRMIAIRDREEVLCWEIKTSCHGIKTEKSYNRSDRSAFRWPYYAHALTDNEIIIKYLSNLKAGIHLKMPFDVQQNYIQKMCFSNSCDLYVLAHHKDRKIVIYRICVGKDTSIEVKQGISRTSKTMRELSEPQSMLKLHMTSQLNSHYDQSRKQIAKPVYEGYRFSSDAEQIFCIEHIVSVQKKSAILVQEGNRISLIVLQNSSTSKQQISISSNKAQKILRLSEDTFVTIDDTGHKLRLLIVRYEISGFQLHETVIYQDFNAIIKNVVGELGKLYVMLDDRLEIQIKVLSFAQNMTNLTVQMSIGEDFELKSDTEFIQAFSQAKFINSDCLIVNEWRLAKVSQTGENQQAIFQTYFNFLPEDSIKDSDRCLLVDQCEISRNHRRLALIFNYPESCQPKKVQVQPFFDDNRVSISQKQGQICWTQTNQQKFGLWESQSKKSMPQEMIDSLLQSQTSKKRIFQFLPTRWKLYEYNMAGLMKKITSYDTEMSQYHQLAKSSRDPIFLMTPYGTEYLNEIHVRRITGEKESKLLAKINLKEVFIERPRSIFTIRKPPKVSIFEEIKTWQQKQGCKPEFRVNSSGRIALALVHPSGVILVVFILSEIQKSDRMDLSKSTNVEHLSQFEAIEVALKDPRDADSLPNGDNLESQENKIQEGSGVQQTQQTSAEESLMTEQPEFTSRRLNAEQDTQNQAYQSEEFQKGRFFSFAKNFSLSNSKILLWNKKTILQGSITASNSNASLRKIVVNKLALEIAALSDCLSVQREKKKFEKMKEFNETQLNSTVHQKFERKDYVKDVDDYFDLVECHDVQVFDKVENKSFTTMQVKIVTSGKQSHIMSYNLDNDREVTWIGASTNSRIFYGSSGDCYVHDEELGIINLHSKEQMLEYHARDKNQNFLAFDKVEFGVSWGNRFICQPDKNLLIFANHLLLPYSYFNIIQRFRSLSKDRERKTFWVRDYCRIVGANNLHKCKFDPAQIEKILTCYWNQDPMYIASVLVRQQINLAYSQKQTRFTESTRTETNNIVETQVEISSYRLINKILFYLSQLPPTFSFYQLMPVFKDMTSFTFFDNYMSTWLQQTNQMALTQVLFTSMPRGCQHIINESSYLDKDFFMNYPVQNYDRNRLPDYATYKKFKNAKMQQVSIKMVQVSWIKDVKNSKQFFESLVSSGSLDLFKNPNMVTLIRYMWDICYAYFVYYRFLPFIFCCYIPITVFTFVPLDTDDEVYNIVQLCCLALTSIYLLTRLYSQIIDICELSCTGYFTSFNSMVELFLIAILSTFVYYGTKIVVNILGGEVTTTFLETMRLLEIGIMLILNLQLFRFLKIFQFFQSFIRQFLEIIKSTAQIASMLFFVILTQAVLFKILDQNSYDPVYSGEGFSGFMKAVLDSYVLAIGDFEPVQTVFVDNSAYEWLFWVIFFFGTLVNLVILLNMVIAVMSMELENVVNDQEALVNREKLIDIMDNIHRLPRWIRRQFRDNKYLFIVEVDPVFDLAQHNAEEASDKDEILANEERLQAQLQSQLQMLTMMGDKQKVNYRTASLHGVGSLTESAEVPKFVMEGQ